MLGETFEVSLNCWATLCCCESFQEGWLEDGILLVCCTDLLLLRLLFLEGEEDRLSSNRSSNRSSNDLPKKGCI